MILDSSCAVAIISPDEQNDAVLALLDRIIAYGAFAPALWLYETANAARFKWAKDEITAATARDAIEKLHALPIETVDMEPAVIRGGILTLAQRHNLTIYDASYLHLAVMLSLPLATFDKQLIASAPKEGVELVKI
nr:type II toxin-antitoxin system VapC family toxin [Bosea sp. WAO]